METLIGWGLLLGFVLFLVGLMKVAGPPGESKPHCGVRDGGSSGGCH